MYHFAAAPLGGQRAACLLNDRCALAVEPSESFGVVGTCLHAPPRQCEDLELYQPQAAEPRAVTRIAAARVAPRPYYLNQSLVVRPVPPPSRVRSI